jgi:tRNA(Ile2) C34 agmatinyltransferase TiaS
MFNTMNLRGTVIWVAFTYSTMHGIDPYSPNESTYECTSCGARIESGDRCPDCEADLRNISVPRE